MLVRDKISKEELPKLGRKNLDNIRREMEMLKTRIRYKLQEQKFGVKQPEKNTKRILKQKIQLDDMKFSAFMKVINN